jgi:uncharacterized lipoprotein YmbA
MKPSSSLFRFSCLAALSALLAGCLFKPVTVTSRRFVLTPVAVPSHPAVVSTPLSVGVGLVKMPAYLLQSSLAIRSATNEIVYLENALWAERLDQSFQRTLAANLAALLPTDQIRLSAWQRDEVAVTVSVTVERFDVDVQGQGTLVAWWRIASPGNDTILRHGESRLSKAGPSPGTDLPGVARTLSDLTADLSQRLAQAIREVAPRQPKP